MRRREPLPLRKSLPPRSTDRPNGVLTSSRDPVITSSPMVARVIAATIPGGPIGSRRQGPASATTAITIAQPAASEYKTAAGCGSDHQGTRLARNVPAGTEPAMTPATLAAARRRLRRSSCPPRNPTAITPNTTSSAATKTAKNQPHVAR
jgi:hypothetical protein